MQTNSTSWSQKLFRKLLRVFPADFCANYGGEMEGVFREQHREAGERGGMVGLLRLWAETLSGIFSTAPREHWEILKSDCAYAFRMMRNNLGFTTIAIITLGLGIGVNTALFSVVHAVLMRPLPYPNGSQLVFVRQQESKVGQDDIGFSVHEIEDYRDQTRTLSGLVEYHSMSFTLFGHGDPDRVTAGVVSPNYFEFFGIKPLLGRTFVAQDDEPGAPAVLVLSYEYWKGRFGGDMNIVGRTFELNDKVHTVVGVLPPVPQYPHDNDVYMPSSACPFRGAKAFIANRDARMMEVFGRLKPGVSLASAQADLATIAGRLRSAYPKSYPDNIGYTAEASSLREELTSKARPTLLVLLAAAAFVLLIACANVANLTLARMVRRERELAVRTALGAGRSRLLRQLLTESFLLALAGGIAGLFLAYGSLGLLTEFAARLTPRAREIQIDKDALLFTLLAALGTSVAFGSIAALFGRVNVSSGLKEGSAGAGAGGGSHRNRFRSALIVSQVAFSFMLLIGAGLMLRSLMKMQEVNPGFVPQHVLAMRMTFNFSKYTTTDQYADIGKKVVERVESEPGVISAAVTSSYPMQPEIVTAGPGAISTSFQIEGQTLSASEAPPVGSFVLVSPEYFKTLGVPLMEGREFSRADETKTLQVAIVNEAMKRRYWVNEDPVGKRVSADGGKTWMTVVGIVGDVRDFGVIQPAAAQFYLPQTQNPQPSALIVRTAADPGSMARAAIRAIHDVDSQTAVSKVLTLEQAQSDAIASPRVMASLLGIFAGLALLIAAAGIGGIMALAVGQRVREIGIRMALGAQPSAILRMILRQGLAWVLLGVGLGLLGAFALTGILKSFLFEVGPTDPLTFAGVAFVLIAAAVIATLLPARRAASIDPNVALRSE